MLTAFLFFQQAGFERPAVHGVMAKAEILSVDNGGVKRIGFISEGAQLVRLK